MLNNQEQLSYWYNYVGDFAGVRPMFLSRRGLRQALTALKVKRVISLPDT